MRIFAVIAIAVLFVTAVYANDEPIIGDTNGDGRITSADATKLARYLAGQFEHDPYHITHTDEWRSTADINCDGEVTLDDLVRLAQALVGHFATLCPYGECAMCVVGFAAGTLGDIPVGDRVYIRENGVLVPFIVVQQGRPAGLLPNGNINRPAVPPDNMFVRNTTQITAYANWTYSTILMRERVINPIRMGRTIDRTGNVFRHSDVFAWLNDTYFTWLNQPVQDAVINKTIPVVQCSGQYLTMDRQARPPHIGNMTQRLWISNMNARVWIPNAAEVGVPWHLDNANPASGFPNTLSVLHWMPGAGTTRAGWDNAIRFEYFPFGHGQNPTRPLAAIASEARIAYCDDDIPRLWWTRCPGHQPVGGAFGTAVSEVGQGVRRFYTTLGWVRPTMGFPQSLVLGPGNEITGIGAATAPLAAMEYVFPEFTTGPAIKIDY